MRFCSFFFCFFALDCFTRKTLFAACGTGHGSKKSESSCTVHVFFFFFFLVSFLFSTQNFDLPRLCRESRFFFSLFFFVTADDDLHLFVASVWRHCVDYGIYVFISVARCWVCIGIDLRPMAGVRVNGRSYANMIVIGFTRLTTFQFQYVSE